MSEFVIDQNGYQIWYDLKSKTYNFDEKIIFVVKNRKYNEFYIRPHHEDGPAIIGINGYKSYCINGKRHREDGPSEIFCSGIMYWWLHDVNYPFIDWCSKLNKSEEEINFLKLKYSV